MHPMLRVLSLFTLLVTLSSSTSADTAVKPLDAKLSNYAYPYPVEELPLQLQQQRLTLAYMDIPASKDVTPRGAVLLLHGKNFSGAYWRDTIAALTELGYRVIAPDQIGFGKSSKPLRFQYSLHAMADHTHTLLNKLGIDKVAVVGHSMGGMLATRYALMYPQQVEKLVLVNPIGLEDWKRHVPYQPLEKAIANEYSQTPDKIKRYMTNAYFDGQWQENYDSLLDIQAGWTLGPNARRMAVIDALTADMIFTQPVLYEFPDLQVPTLLIIGTRDRTAIGRDRAPDAIRETLGRYDQLGRQTAKVIPKAKLVELNDVGHVPQFEAFDLYIAPLSKFLQN
ncbi:Pimeloyl-ACP methyl ester carboxylesterase [Microbulbifer donghaiensis]|uniref:Pimeloyl-ACP methyl ester carboxylesterase n=1 Tax=Microbulbifer donghaiensis TaxID=494016 RepID=A0A1M5ELN2_9GAMM|nr:alpha/beta hydrolase [Microbulbifer donghaiensis]SHF80208.1 Pimeloyl-ACP methyl ester carboxylesterase [Microbulbifer donghaiensis]